MNWPVVIVVATYTLYEIFGCVGKHYYFTVRDDDKAVLWFRVQGLVALVGAFMLLLFTGKK